MGGDDLISDDEFSYSSNSNFKQSPKFRDTATHSSDDYTIIAKVDSGKQHTTSSSSKKRRERNDSQVLTSLKDSPSSIFDSCSNKHQKIEANKTQSSKSNVLIHAGRGIALDRTEAQAVFISTCYSHVVKMSAGTSNTIEENHCSEEQLDPPKKLVDPLQFQFQPHHFHATPVSCQHSNLSIYVKQSGVLPSLKRLKNWPHYYSPMVLVITLSARRCVELLQQLSSLKLPVAKLFAKHMRVEDQAEMLCGGNSAFKTLKNSGSKRKHCYGIGVGTPARLLTLLHYGKEGPDKQGALQLNHTEIIIIDCHEDSKGFNVCTLKDTAVELMEFIKEGVIPELGKRIGKLKLALF